MLLVNVMERIPVGGCDRPAGVRGDL